MGLMLPFALHGPGAFGGLVFVMVHVAVVALVVCLSVCVTRLMGRARWLERVRSHRPKARHLAGMGAMMALGAGAICGVCFGIGWHGAWM